MTDFRRASRDRSAMRQWGNYVLIAMPNTVRAAAYRTAVGSTTLDAVLVRDGDEAKQQITRRGTPTLLILDLSLPKIDGFELLRELRQHASAGETGAIVVSGHSAIRAAARRLAEALGISRVLSFDIEHAALREAIDATLNELNSSRTAAVVVPPTVLEKTPASPGGVDELIDGAVMAAAQRFRVAITIAYVKVGQKEYVRGHFGLSDPDDTVNTLQSVGFLRQVAGGSDTLIVPNVLNYPAIQEIAPAGMALVRGLAATPLAGHPEISGALCIMDTNPLQIDATELDAFEALARELHRNLTGSEAVVDNGAAPAATPVDIDSLERLASADPLTGLANRRGGEKDIAAEISRARRQNSALSCVLLDIDHFKEVNDTFGHQAGDYVLREMSALLRRTVRAYDILVRWGGEEFLVVLPGVDQDQALKLAERIRHAIEHLPLAGIGNITASIGVAALGTDYSFDSMFAIADRRLYSAKAAGRNTVA